MNIYDLKTSAQTAMLRKICKQISECGNEQLDDVSETLLIAITNELDSQSQDDAWGTEGWEHFFGVEE